MWIPSFAVAAFIEPRQTRGVYHEGSRSSVSRVCPFLWFALKLSVVLLEESDIYRRSKISDRIIQGLHLNQELIEFVEQKIFHSLSLFDQSLDMV